MTIKRPEVEFRCPKCNVFIRFFNPYEGEQKNCPRCSENYTFTFSKASPVNRDAEESYDEESEALMWELWAQDLEELDNE